MSYYQRTILSKIKDRYGTEIAESLDPRTPRWIEAWMRLKFGTLDALGPTEFMGEIREALRIAASATAEENESLAASYGLLPRN